jgi:hypothetical protein
MPEFAAEINADDLDWVEIIKQDFPVLIGPSVPLEIVEIAMEKRADEVCRSQDVFGADIALFSTYSSEMEDYNV